MLIYQISYAVFCVAFAYLNAKWIKDGKRIRHFWNGLIHIVAAVAGLYFFNWQTGLSILFIARLFFDWSLNLMRGLPLGYVPIKPISYVDKFEKWIFSNNGILPKIIYIAVIILLNII